MLQWSGDKQSRPRVKCVISVSFTHESSSSYLQETAKAHLCDHRQTWHVLYSLSFSLIGVFDFLDGTFLLQAFPRFEGLIWGHMERNSPQPFPCCRRCWPRCPPLSRKDRYFGAGLQLLALLRCHLADQYWCSACSLGIDLQSFRENWLVPGQTQD